MLDIEAEQYRLTKNVFVSICCETGVGGIRVPAVSNLDVEAREDAGVDTTFVNNDPELDVMLEEVDPEPDTYEFGNINGWFGQGWRDRARAVSSSLCSRVCNSALVSGGMGSITS